MPKKPRSHHVSVEEIIDNRLDKQLLKEETIQKRLQNKEAKEFAVMEKLEQKKQDLLDKKMKKEQQKEFKLQTKLALKGEQTTRKNSNIQVNLLNKSNNTYTEKLSHVQLALDNDILKLNRTNKELEQSVNYKENVEDEIQRIEEERRKEIEDNSIIQDILLQKKNTIQTALDELVDLSVKTNTEYDKLQDNKSVNKFELGQAELKLALMKKYA